MLAPRETPPADPNARQVVGYIEEMVRELADLAARHGRTDLAASLSIVVIQAGGDRRRLSQGDR